MNNASDLTITSACDSNYFWGVLLMVGTARQHGMRSPIHILGKNFTGEQKQILEQFEGVSVLPLPSTERNLTTSKPEALFTTNTEWMAWVDADCVFTGDVTEALFPANGEIQIRVRGEAENLDVFRAKYLADEPHRGVARHVHERWRVDVHDLAEPRLQSTCVANVMVLHRRFRPFVELWRKQMATVLSSGSTGVLDTKNPWYHQTDESVLNSLLTFSSLAPRVDGPYRLDRVEGPHIGHFGGPTKPWRRWTWRALNWYPTVIGFIAWCGQHGYRIPPIPWSLKKDYQLVCSLLAGAEHAALTTKRRAGNIIRARLPKKSA